MQVETSHTLAGIKLFEALDEAERRRLESRCTWRRCGAGETVLERGSESREVLFIIDGAVNILNVSLSGREVAYTTLRAGDCFGEFAAIDGQPRSASVVAVEECRLAALAPETFRRLWQDHPAIADRVMTRLAAIVRSCDERIMDLSTVRAVHRVYAELVRLAIPDVVAPENRVIRPMRTHSDIASRVSTTRETVARVLGQLASDGVVERKSKTLYIRDFERLAKLAERGNELENEPAR